MFDPALANHESAKHNPYKNTTRIFMAKVIALHPDKGTVDVALAAVNHQGGIMKNVRVVSPSAGVQTGHSYFPSVDLAQPQPQPNAPYDQPLKSGGQDVWCVVGFLDGFAQTPVCLGFLQPYESIARPSSVGMEADVHESGVYRIITKDGHDEIHLPDGSYIILATDTSPVDMTTENPNWNPPTTTTSYHLTLNFKGNVTLNVGGNAVVNASEVYLGTSAGNGVPVARKGDAVSVDTTTGVGTITSGSSKTYSG